MCLMNNDVVLSFRVQKYTFFFIRSVKSGNFMLFFDDISLTLHPKKQK